jgi:ferritin-like metal-binding protein YciE
MTAYGTARTYTDTLGNKKAASLLQEILDEEKETDLKLTGLAEKIDVKPPAAAAR